LRLVIVNTHPIQYFAPFYRALEKRLGSDAFTVVYCSKKGLAVSQDNQFGERFQWDVDLLQGYSYLFTDEADGNVDLDASKISCRTLPELLGQLEPEILLVHGYYGPVAQYTLRWARKNPCKVLMRGDTWAGLGEGPGWWRQKLKRVWFRNFILPHVYGFLAVGKRNQTYWSELGGNKERIWMVPYGIDKGRFKPLESSKYKNELRKKYGIFKDVPTVGFFGKFIEKKGISQLLEFIAYSYKPVARYQFILVGSGDLKERVESASRKIGVPIFIMGFRNQTEIPDLYRACDLVVVPSYGETWGFVVQESLACGVPVAVSENVGCVPDLIKNGVNGWILPNGQWKVWGDFLEKWAGGGIYIKCSPEEEANKIPGFEDSAKALVQVLESFK
jgi:glycosyltransferase involved in cell wall biosynthesis